MSWVKGNHTLKFGVEGAKSIALLYTFSVPAADSYAQILLTTSPTIRCRVLASAV